MVSFDMLQSEGPLPSELHDTKAADELVINTELSSEIASSLDLLSDRERSVFILKHQHGYKLREIAKMIGCAEGTVKNYLFRATRKVRTALAGFAPSESTAAEFEASSESSN